ncbi:hypothetical protein [Streptacidiphilus rugosus]|nr:hypothetical protein [Streptacidiphilus rugosus]
MPGYTGGGANSGGELAQAEEGTAPAELTDTTTEEQADAAKDAEAPSGE